MSYKASMTKAKFAQVLLSSYFPETPPRRVEQWIGVLCQVYVAYMHRRCSICLRGVGFLNPIEKKARIGRDPKTLKPFPISARTVYSMSKTGCVTSTRINETDVIRDFSRLTTLSYEDAGLIVREFVVQLRKVRDEGGLLSFRGFGSFKVTDFERNTHNPKTGEQLGVRSHVRMKFKSFVTLK